MVSKCIVYSSRESCVYMIAAGSLVSQRGGATSSVPVLLSSTRQEQQCAEDSNQVPLHQLSTPRDLLPAVPCTAVYTTVVLDNHIIMTIEIYVCDTCAPRPSVVGSSVESLCSLLFEYMKYRCTRFFVTQSTLLHRPDVHPNRNKQILSAVPTLTETRRSDAPGNSVSAVVGQWDALNVPTGGNVSCRKNAQGWVQPCLIPRR